MISRRSFNSNALLATLAIAVPATRLYASSAQFVDKKQLT